MIITFLLHSGIRKPSGGVKIILDYANALATNGHKIFIVQPCFLTKETTSFFNSIRRFLYYKITKRYKPNWFSLHKNVIPRLVWSLKEKNIPTSEICIATFIETAFWLDTYIRCKQKFYFIQDFENWYTSDFRVYESYKLNLNKIVVSDWLKQYVESCGQSCKLVFNGFDTKIFYQRNLERPRNTILFMWHEDERKRCIDSIKAIQIVKEIIPDLKISVFSAFDNPNIKEFNYDFYQKASPELLSDLYNTHYVYIAASREEGWGLTVGEAMLCGCAVACTENNGFKIMAEDKVTALVSPIYDYEKLAANILQIINNKELHEQLVKNAYEKMQNFSIEKSRKDFISAIIK